jgi:hypothetical protein
VSVIEMTTCECGMYVETVKLRRHKKTASHVAAIRIKELCGLGLRTVDRDLGKLAKDSGVLIQLEKTRRSGRSWDIQAWVPAWLPDIFGKDFYTLTAPFVNHTDACKMVGAVLKRAVEDLDYRDALHAARKLNGIHAVLDIAAPASYRAERLRARGRRLLDEGRSLMDQANVMDPPGDDS